jgi:phosphoribosylformylglycinamidine cyclo-ligase
MIHEQSQTDWQEMYKVFNMGHRMEIYTDSETAKDIIEISKSFNVDAKVIGYCEAYDGKKVTVKSDKGTFTYLG